MVNLIKLLTLVNIQFAGGKSIDGHIDIGRKYAKGIIF